MQSWLDGCRAFSQSIRDFGDTWGLSITLVLVAAFVGFYIYTRIHARIVRSQYYKDYIKRKRT